MPFMREEITQKQPGFIVETTAGVSYVPSDVAGQCTRDGAELLEHVRAYVDGEPLSVERVTGYFGRYSAPGYLDATEWEYSASRDALAAELAGQYGEPCRVCVGELLSDGSECGWCDNG